jgi:hypothetical protein
MYKLITSTWGNTPNYSIENTITYRSFSKYNNPENFVTFYFNRGAYHVEEHEYNSRMGTQAEYILYKIDLLREKIRELDTEYLIFCDANDVYCTGTVDHLFSLFDLDNYVVFSSERNDWPKDHMNAHWENYKNYSQYDRTNRMFLNSGVQLAKKSRYLEMLDNCMEKCVSLNLTGAGGDQGIYTYYYNMIDEPRIILDYANLCALSTYDSNINDYYEKNGKIYSKKYGTSPVFIHDSGMNYGGQKFGMKFNLL